MRKMARIWIAAIVAVSIGVAAPALGASGTWNVDAGGLWGTSTNWLDEIIADGAGNDANFTNDISADTTVDLDSDRTIGNLNFSDGGESGSQWTLQSTGGYKLTLDAATPTITATTAVTITNAWAINAAELAGSGTVTLTGAMDPLSQNLTILRGSNLRIDSDISDGGNGYSVTYDAEHIWRHLTLAGNNTFSGDFIHKLGILHLASNNCLGTGDWIIEGYRLPDNQLGTDIRVTGGDVTIPNNLVLRSNVHTNASLAGPQWTSWARFNMIGSGSDGKLTINGQVILEDPEGDETFRAYFVRGSGLEFAGGIHEGVNGSNLELLIDGSGAPGSNTVISGTSTFTGGTTIARSAVWVNAADGLGTGRIVLRPPGGETWGSAILGGTGSVSGPVTAYAQSSGVAGAIWPGMSVGTFTIDNDLTMHGYSQLQVDIDSAASSDLLVVNGDVTLTSDDFGGEMHSPVLVGRVLNPDIANAAVVTILQNDGADPIVGTFDGLAEGATVDLTSGDPMLIVISATATISYVGGTGNDITLTNFVIDALLLGDMDGSGAVNNNDITPFVLALTDRPTYLATYPGLDPDVVGDIDGSGVLNNNDITPFVTLLTTGSYPQAVPEPATMALLALGGLALLKRRSR